MSYDFKLMIHIIQHSSQKRKIWAVPLQVGGEMYWYHGISLTCFTYYVRTIKYVIECHHYTILHESILVFWLGFGAFPMVFTNLMQSCLKLIFDEVQIISRSWSSSTMPHHFFAESDPFSSGSLKPTFVGRTPPVYSIVTVTVTTQFSLHGVAFVINLILCFFLLSSVY